jgi:ATP-binding cassette subfamily B multidrug efflux pump
MGEVNGYIEEMYQGHQIIKTYCRETNVITKFNELNEEYYRVTWKAQYYSGLLNPGLYFILHFSYVIICVMGGVFAVNGRLSLGMILAFIQYSRDSFDPVLEIADSLSALQAGVAAAKRVFEILDEPEELPDSVSALSIGRAEGKVLFEEVDFGYKPGLTVIDGLNLVVDPGQTVALVGPTGVGKTTLINLLMRFYERNGGRIMIDGVDIAALKREELRGFFGIVMQDPWLFSGTIKDNIAYGKKNASESQIIAAAQAAYAYHFIKTLPDGFDTVLKEDAANISQGQKQLLTIARAILTDPTILILDEATSSIDTRTELCIQRAIKNLMQGRTCFVIAHRLSTIKEADRILVMKEGRVIEQGNQEELLEKKGFYSELYNSQFAVD